MKLRSLILVTLLALLVTPALAGKTVQGTPYGKALTGSDTVALSELMKNPDKYVGKTVRVEGLVVDVCAKRGCWMELAGDQEFQSIKIKVDDGVIVFPMEAKGKKAVAEGVFDKIVMGGEKHEAHAEHAKHAEGEPCDKSAEHAKKAPCDKSAKGEPCDKKAKGEPCDKEKAAKEETRVVYLIRGTGAVVR